MTQEVFVIDVIQSVVDSMRVQIYGKPVPTFHKINFNPGRSEQIIKALENMDGTVLQGEKYPLVAVEMPFDQDYGSGFDQVTFKRIVIADITKTGEREEPVIQKYELGGKFKTVLMPCVREFIKRLAWSTSTGMGDPDAYLFTLRELPGQVLTGKGTNDFVDIIEIINLNAIIFSQIKTCTNGNN